ncbi:hypothetical protein IJG14_05045 [bacterium]|nr:hypothetical protein [bacterium]
MSERNHKIIFIGSFIIVTALAILAVYSSKMHKEETFTLNLSASELDKRTDSKYLIDINLLDENAPEYKNLSNNDKEALKHLVKAAYILENIQLNLDNRDNIAFKNFLIKESNKGNKNAQKTLILFNAQRGMNAIDRESHHINLAKNHDDLLGKGFYPADLSEKEFHLILTKMIKNGEVDMVKKILNQRSIVERNGDKLIATDYIDKFKEEFNQIANELEAAAQVSSDDNFNEYLNLQAKALRTANPMLDAYADKKWATLQNTPLEFTITRENYSDGLTKTILSNPELANLLKEVSITPIMKDSLGCRVGIVNQKATENLLKIKQYLPKLASLMPFHEKYQQNIKAQGEVKQTMVDVDLVAMTGDCGAYRGGITIAENLPNDDKLSLTIGGGRRNVYHRQVRQMFTPEKTKKKIDAILDSSLHKYYNTEASHWFTAGHENMHSLGPNSGCENLGKYQSIIEENKADMGSLAFIDVLVKEGMYDENQRNQIIVTSVLNNFLKAKPTMAQAHRVRSIMQIHYLKKEGAIAMNKEDKIYIDRDKAVLAAQKMLKDIIKIQISKDINKAEKFVNDNFVWDEMCEKIAIKLKSVDS